MDASSPQKARALGLSSGIGLVVADMIGAGVFLSAGFMAQDMGPGLILLAWAVGLVLALAGARSYAALAAAIPRSGGEYRYLSDLIHPALGYLSGWTSLLFGFTAPIAIDAIAAGQFARTVIDVDPLAFGCGLVIVLTLVHAVGLRPSAVAQNVLVIIKILLVLGFLGIGLAVGARTWPTWVPPNPSDGFPVAAFAGSLFYVAFAFSGWNAASYASEEFAHPTRDVPRAMLIGCALVGLLYLAANWVFVANVTPDQAQAVFGYENTRITLGHVVMQNLLGDTGAAVMSGVMVLVFASAVSALLFVGPRISAAMARDGFLPKALVARPGRPPVGAILLQGGLALVLVFAWHIQQILQDLGAILTLFSALAALALVRLWLRGPGPGRPSTVSVVAALVYASSSAGMLYFGFRDSPGLLIWVGVATAIALAAYGWNRFRASHPR
jgi:APA family basic amino acid/polyamine antiporter